ncbi:thioesterase family protein [bacterium]|jgi:acyl-CoA thioester hydrolase|nr:thioesterase family protein [bacterium]
MSRVQLKPLDYYKFSLLITVRTTDLNYGGHLGNDKLLSLIHEARVAYLESLGYKEREFAGVSLIMGDSAIVYQGEGFAGDKLKIEVDCSEVTRCGFRLNYRVTKSDNSPIALVENGMICFDYENKKVIPLPDEAKTKLGK